MKRIYIIITLLITLLTATLFAQDPLDPGWLWAERGGSSGSFSNGQFDAKYERIVDVAVDSENNYYYLAEVGGFTFTLGDMEFDTYNDYDSDRDIFVFSTDSEGTFRWGKTIGGGYNEMASSLNLDSQNNVYVAGFTINVPTTGTAYDTSVHFDTDSIMPVGTTSPSPANKKIFLIKYDSNGNFQWLRQPESNETPISYSGVMLKMIVEPNGTTHSLIALIAGTYFDGQLTIPPMDTIGNLIPPQTMIIKYDSAGTFIDYLLIDMKATTGAYWTQFAYDPNLDRYYIADTYTTNDISPDNPLSINGYGADTPYKAFYLAAVSNQGEVIWYHENEVFGGFATGDVALDNTGNIYFTGYTSANLGPDNIAGFVFDPDGINSGKQDPFLVKLNSDGNLLWGTNANLHSPFLAQSIVVSANNVYLGLGMVDNVWDELEVPGPVLQGLIPDIQIIRFDAETGVAQEVISNNAITPTRDAIMAMALDNNGDLIVGGYFGSSLFPGSDCYLQNTGPDSDFFIAKYQPQDTGVGISEASVLKTVMVYPNPTSGLLNLQSQVALTSYTLCDLQGRVVNQGNLTSNQVDLSGLESGVYVLGLLGVDENVWNTKVVIE